MPHPPRGPTTLIRYELLLRADQLVAVDERRRLIEPGKCRPPSRADVIRSLLDGALNLAPERAR